MTLDIKENLLSTFDFSYLFNTNISLYIHFPFCVKKCTFCPIKTEKYGLCFVSDYIETLKNEIVVHMKELDGSKMKVESIHFGGGTPSLMEASQLDGILNTISQFINIESSEIIFEMHPKLIKHELLQYLSELQNCTANLGVQSFNDSVLLSTNRHYNHLDILHIVELIKKKVGTIGIDYICDWQTADLKTLETDLKYIELIHPDHISQYPLYTKPHRPDKKHVDFRDRATKDISKKEALNHMCERYLNHMGYNRYSIFHYENKKSVSHIYGRRQLTGGKWIGFGADAYTYLGDLMWLNSNIDDYRKGNFIYKQCRLDYRDRFLWEFLFLIRTIPLSKETVIKKYEKTILKSLDLVIQKLQERHYIDSANDISLTWNGVIHLDDVERLITNVFVKGTQS